jgi:hypothetical protein
MKPFSFLKIPVILVGLGTLLLFTPTCKAQSEVSPDHFDGTDSWEIAARTPVAENQAGAGNWFVSSAEQKGWLGGQPATRRSTRCVEILATQRSGGSGQAQAGGPKIR